MKETSRGMLPVLIGFGSETGTAQETAEHLHREFLYRDIPVKIAPMNQLSISQIHPDIVSFQPIIIELYRFLPRDFGLREFRFKIQENRNQYTLLR